MATPKPTSGFGSRTSTGSGMFGSSAQKDIPASGGLFGSKPSPPSFAFGASAQKDVSASGGMFGSKSPLSTGSGASPPGFGFGSPGGFGSKSATGSVFGFGEPVSSGEFGHSSCFGSVALSQKDVADDGKLFTSAAGLGALNQKAAGGGVFGESSQKDIASAGKLFGSAASSEPGSSPGFGGFGVSTQKNVAGGGGVLFGGSGQKAVAGGSGLSAELRQKDIADGRLSGSTAHKSVADENEVASNYESGVGEEEEEEEEEKVNTPPAPATLLSEDPFSNESSRILFDSIDQLRRCGAGQDLDLPQLVIVGKQSAGKSSLLQSLTDIPFPVGNKLCTQFAMRIVSRRTAPGTSEMVHASIEAGDVNPFSVSNDDARIQNFDRRIPSMTAEAFEQLIVEAKEAMGIGSPLLSEDKNYSSKVLKIELSGPKRSHFAILDLPGVFSSRRGGVSKREMDGVLSMVKSYMRKPENIVICCADASGDIQNEQILELASDVDSSRLVGVFTKCDKSENPDDMVKYVNDRDGIPGKPLRWHVVQNKGPKANPSYDRVKEETATFNKYPWNKIPDDQRGTESLKRYLANLLCTRIRDGFPAMLSTVTALLQTEKERRKQIGNARQDHHQKLAYLLEISQKFEKLARQALEEPGRLLNPVLKLRGQAEELKEGFTMEMMDRGHLHKFLEIDEDVNVVVPGEPEVKSESRSGDEPFVNTPNPNHATWKLGHTPLTPVDSPSRKTKTEAPVPKTQTQPLYLEIRRQIIENRGEELPGMLNPAVLRPLWYTQTSKWEDVGMKHLNELVDLTTAVAKLLFQEACNKVGVNDRARNGLEARLISFSDQSRIQVLSKIEKLCQQNSTMALQTNNPLFLNKVRAARMQRFSEALKRYRKAIPAQKILPFEIPSGMALVDEAHIDDLFNEMHPNGTRAQNVEDEIHDLLKAYYEVTLQNFVYDVTRNISEPFLLDKNGPLLGLSTDFILGLSEEEVAELGGEEEGVVVQRREIDGKIKRLEEAVGIAGVSLGRTRGAAMAVGA